MELGKGELRVVLYGRQNVSDLMFKKKLLLLITELVVILKYLDWLYDQLCDPNPLHLQKWTKDLLFKNKKKWYDFFSVLEKITILLFERNKPTIKMLLKDTSKP